MTVSAGIRYLILLVAVASSMVVLLMYTTAIVALHFAQLLSLKLDLKLCDLSISRTVAAQWSVATVVWLQLKLLQLLWRIPGFTHVYFVGHCLSRKSYQRETGEGQYSTLSTLLVKCVQSYTGFDHTSSISSFAQSVWTNLICALKAVAVVDHMTLKAVYTALGFLNVY
ncbi:hypothetical protein J6590_084095 [Homalodisca vitripennis]|nr:hypothetical protein J6590_084095 [Homalodisca vitripennis]